MIECWLDNAFKWFERHFAVGDHYRHDCMDRFATLSLAGRYFQIGAVELLISRDGDARLLFVYGTLGGQLGEEFGIHVTVAKLLEEGLNPNLLLK